MQKDVIYEYIGFIHGFCCESAFAKANQVTNIQYVNCGFL